MFCRGRNIFLQYVRAARAYNKPRQWSPRAANRIVVMTTMIAFRFSPLPRSQPPWQPYEPALSLVASTEAQVTK